MIALPGLCLALLAPGLAADVWEVGGGGAATIDAAIALASEGDVILVHAGTHPGFSVDAKSLVITGDAGENVVVQGTVLPAGGELTVEGPVPDLGASVQGLTLHLQAVGLSSFGGLMLGEPATLVLLDSAL